MIERTERPMTDAERETVRIFTDGWARTSMPILTIVGILLIGASMVVMLMGSSHAQGRAAGALIRWLFIGGFVLVGLVGHLLWSLKRRAGWSQDLGDGIAETSVITVEGEVAKVVVVAAANDSRGPIWILDIGGGQVLLLRGDYLKQYEDDGVFPSTKMEIVRAKTSGLELSTRCTGERVAVGRVASTPLAANVIDGSVRHATVGDMIDQLSATV